jgi:DNA-binding NarL/FixJ family response regulator
VSGGAPGALFRQTDLPGEIRPEPIEALPMSPASKSPAPAEPLLRLVIADDHPIVRSGIKNELQRQAGMEVIGEAGDGDETLRLAQTAQPDVLLLDIHMPGLKAVQLVRELRSLPAPPRVLILSADGDMEYVLAMLRAGAIGYLLKDEASATIVEGVRAVGRGEIWLSAKVAASLVTYSITETPDAHTPHLTVREKEVVSLVARGYDNPHIAGRLSLSEGTVKNHITNIYDKLSLHSRAELVAWAWENGMVDKT